MKALSNIQGPMGGEPLCFYEVALIFIGHEHKTGSLNWWQGRRGLQLLLGAYTCPWSGLKKTGGAPTQAFGFGKFSVTSDKLKQFLADFWFCQVFTNANCTGYRHGVCIQYKKAHMVILNPCVKLKLLICLSLPVPGLSQSAQPRPALESM